MIRIILFCAFLWEFIISRNLWIGYDREVPLISAFSGLEFEFGLNFRLFLMLLLGMSLLLITIAKSVRKWAFLSFFILSMLLILEDINRLQPWYFMQTMILWVVCSPPTKKKGSRKTMVAIILILAGTYVWSGIQKMNVSFITEVAPWLMEGLGFENMFPTAEEKAAISLGSVPSRFWLFLLIPLWEVLQGFLLLFKRSRRIGCWMSMGMHLLVMGVIGPWATAYNTIILPWNISLFLILLIAVPRAEKEVFLLEGIHKNLKLGILTLLFWILPALNFIRMNDHYLSSGLYSGARDTASYSFYKDLDGRHDDIFRSVMMDRYDDKGLYYGSEVDLDKWMLSSNKVPLYGEPRYYKRMIKKLCQKSEFKEGAGLIIDYRERFNGKKSRFSCYCTELIEDDCELPF